MPTALEVFLADAKRARIFNQEHLLAEITELICKMMQRQGVTRRELARRLDKIDGQVDAILNGETVLTVQQVADVFTVLGLELRIAAVPMQKSLEETSK
jgi:cyanate lyase